MCREDGKRICRAAEVTCRKRERQFLDVGHRDSRHGGTKVAARIIHTASINQDGTAFASKVHWCERVFCTVSDGRIRGYDSVDDKEVATAKPVDTWGYTSFQDTSDGGLTDLKKFHTDCIHTITTLTMKEDLGNCCQPKVIHNQREYTLDEYREMIESSFDDIFSLQFSIVDLVTNTQTQQIVAQLEFRGRPVKSFRGMQPSSADVRSASMSFTSFR